MELTLIIPDDQVYRIALSVAESRGAPDPVDEKLQRAVLTADIQDRWRGAVSGREVQAAVKPVEDATKAEITTSIVVTAKEDGAVPKNGADLPLVGGKGTVTSEVDTLRLPSKGRAKR